MNTVLPERITFNPKQCAGKPCIRNMRIRMTGVIGLMATGLTPEQIVTEELPDLEPENITACILAAKLNHPVLQAA